MVTRKVKIEKNLGIVEFVCCIDTCDFCGKEMMYNEGSSSPMRKCQICNRHICVDCYKSTDVYIEVSTQYLYCELCCLIRYKYETKIKQLECDCEDFSERCYNQIQAHEESTFKMISGLKKQWKEKSLEILINDERH